MKTKIKILHLEDAPSDAELVERELKKANIQFEKLVVANKTAFEKALKEFAPDIIISDHTLPSFDSLEAIKMIKRQGLKIPIILVTATVSDEYAVEIMKAGADDYILKDRLHRLPQAVLNAMEKNSAEQLLHESEKFNKGVLSSLSSHIAVLDESGTLIATNKAWNDFGIKNGITSLGRVSMGSNYFDVCKQAIDNGDSDAAAALAGIQSVLKKEKPYFEMEYPCHAPNEQRWFMLSTSHFGNEEHRVVVAHIDITERKLAEEKNRFKANLLNTVGQAAIATDLDGVVIYWNKAAEKIYGWKAEEVIGKNIMHLTTSHATREQASEIMDDLKNGRSWSGEFRVQRKDGTDFPAIITNSPIYDENNKLSGVIGISSDITEKKKQEALLDKSSRLARIGSWEIDVVNGTVFWSDITKEIREVDKDYVPILGEGISYFKEGIDRDTISQKVQECIENGTPWDEALQIITFKGNHKWVRTIGEGEFLNGKCLRIHGSFQDITERKNAGIKIRESEQKYRQIASELEIERIRLVTAQSVAKVGSWETDLQTWQVNWSEEMHRLYGTDPNDFEPSYELIQSFVHHEDKKMIDKAFRESLHKSGSNSLEHRIITLKGKEKWVEENWTVTRDETGLPTVAVGTCQDITESKNAAEKVIRSETKLKIAQHIAHVGSYEVDMVTDEHSWSNEFYRILGINRDVKPSRKTFLSFVHPDDRDMAVCTMDEAFFIYSDSSFHFRFIRKNGETGYALSEWKFEFDSNRNPLYIHGILRDLTKEWKAESERAKMISDIVQRNSDLQQFSYIISHNLRAPTANIIGLAEYLQDGTITPLEQKKFLQGLSTSATALDAVIKDINNILQVKSEVNEKKEVIIFSKLVDDIMLSIGHLIDKHRVRIVSDFSEVDELYSLKNYMYSIFYNLIGNSIKYGKPNEPTLIEIKSKKENREITLTFKDNGLGIDLEKHGTNIFGLYRRFHSHVEGKGMGLFMVKTQVESLGGKVTIASELNKGTEITIVFDN